MKQLRLLILAVAATALCTAAAFACGNDKTSAASACASGKKGTAATAASMSGCPSSMASQCTPEMAAACAQMKKGTKASAASASGCPMMGASASGCSMHGTKASAASMSGCSAHGTAATAASAGDCCAGKGKTTATAASAAGGACSAHGKAAMAAGSSCSAHGANAMAMHDCDACSDMAQAENDLAALGCREQVVPLKNGVMYVYTVDSPERVRALQAAVTRNNERAKATLASGDRAKLCPECKQMRGAMASGKLQREVVNVENGAMTLVTSNDRTIVGRLHNTVGTEVAERTAH